MYKTSANTVDLSHLMTNGRLEFLITNAAPSKMTRGSSRGPGGGNLSPLVPAAVRLQRFHTQRYSSAAHSVDSGVCLICNKAWAKPMDPHHDYGDQDESNPVWDFPFKCCMCECVVHERCAEWLVSHSISGELSQLEKSLPMFLFAGLAATKPSIPSTKNFKDSDEQARHMLRNVSLFAKNYGLVGGIGKHCRLCTLCEFCVVERRNIILECSDAEVVISSSSSEAAASSEDDAAPI